MDEGRALTVAMQNELTVSEVIAQVRKIQEIMGQAMKKDTHYGVIPGTDKPSLYQPGAQKLALTFRLGFRNRVDAVDLQDGHREYRSRTTVFHIPSSVELGEVQATCSTMESKYRYRWENTGREVPKEYWDTRDTSLIGGEGFVPRKTRQGDRQAWMVFHRVEHDNPADYYNTCEKMSQKRSEVKGVLNITAASDIFTQDTEDIPEELLNPTGEEAKKEIPACPKCGKPGRESSAEMGGGFYCWKKKGGCGHTWGKPEQGEEAPSQGNGGSKPKPGAYPITPTHEKLYSLIEFECQGDMIKMGDMLEGLTAWTTGTGTTREVKHPGKREVGQISVKQAEYAIEHFKEQFGEEPGSQG